jgi:RND family efflux transporter MFP subunit
VGDRVSGRAAAAVFAAALGLAGCTPSSPTPRTVKPALVQTVSYAPAGAGAVFPGEVKARNETDLAFRIGGKIVAREVDAGASVRKGQVLARLDPADVALAVRTATAQLESAEAEFSLAEAELTRSKSLLEKRFISQTAYDNRQNAYNVARARLDQARSQQQVAQNQASYAQLLAPYDGVITAAPGEPGQVVAAGQAVLRLARPKEKEVWVAVPENRIDEVRGAKSLSVNLWAAPEKRYAARVREIAPAADPVARTFLVKVALTQSDPALRLGMTANLLLDRVDGSAAARLPLPALGSLDGKPVLWVVDGQDAVQPRPVEIVGYAQDAVLVGSGVQEGEKVVIAGVQKLVQGQRVEPRPAPPSGGARP